MEFCRSPAPVCIIYLCRTEPLFASILFHLLLSHGLYDPSSILGDIFLCTHWASVFQGCFTHTHSCFCCYSQGTFTEKKHHYATFRPLSRFMIRETCFDTVFSESVCVINLYKGESSVGYLTLLSARCFTYQCYDGISARICEVPVKC